MMSYQLTVQCRPAGRRTRRACLVMAGLWCLVTSQVSALGLFDPRHADGLLFLVSGMAMWLILAGVAPWIME